MTEIVNSVHSSRTIMTAELGRLFASVGVGLDFSGALAANTIGKATKVSTLKTARYLRKLYLLDYGRTEFRSLYHFWNHTLEPERPLLAMLFAIGTDTLLSESMDVILAAALGKKVGVELFEEQIEKKHPGKYTPITLHSIGKNIASSWKQAGFLKGKFRNTRTEVHPSLSILSFAMFLSYLNGDRGDFILGSKWVRVLGLTRESIIELAYEASQRDLIVIQSSGSVTTISFPQLLLKLGIHENQG